MLMQNSVGSNCAKGNVFRFQQAKSRSLNTFMKPLVKPINSWIIIKINRIRLPWFIIQEMTTGKLLLPVCTFFMGS